MKQALLNLLFQYAFENIDKSIPAPKAFAIAKEEYLDDIDIVELFLDECAISTGEEQDKLKTSELFGVFRDVFKTRCEDTMSIRVFANNLLKGINCKKQKTWRIDVYSENQEEILKR